MASAGERLGSCTLVRRIGPRGAGELWAARTDEGRDLAVHIQPIARVKKEDAERMLAEQLEVAKLVRHENIVRVLGGGVRTGERWMFLELAEGIPLSRIIDAGRSKMPWPSFGLSGYIVYELARALEHLHALERGGVPLGLVHRDVAPRNVLLERSGRIKLSELPSGLESQALIKTAGRDQSGLIAYLSPELASNAKVDAKTDVFAAGVILWELLTRCPLFLRTSDLETLDAIRNVDVPSVPGDCPESLAAVARTCLAKIPAHRPTAAELASELAAAISAFPDATPKAAQVFAGEAIAALESRGPSNAAPPRGRTRPLSDNGSPPPKEAAPHGVIISDTDIPVMPRVQHSSDATRGERDPAAAAVVRADPPPRTPLPPPAPPQQGAAGRDPFYDEKRDIPRGWEGQRFEVIERLGAGGMGEVYKVRDRELDEIVAMKLIPRESTTELRSMERLKREVRLARKIASPYVCRIYDIVDLGAGVRGLTMAVIDGTTLAELMRTGLSVDYRRFARWTADIAEGLAAAHELSIVHRDLKPENVMIRSDDRAVILDFGIASSVEPSDQSVKLTQVGMIMGTPLYMSPEQLLNQHLDGRSDLFALGLMLAELITGDVPMRGATYAELLERRVTKAERYHVRDVDPGVPEELATTIDGLLEQNAGERPASALEIAARMRAFGGVVSDRPLKPTTAPEPGVRTRPELTGSLIGAAKHAAPSNGAGPVLHGDPANPSSSPSLSSAPTSPGGKAPDTMPSSPPSAALARIAAQDALLVRAVRWAIVAAAVVILLLLFTIVRDRMGVEVIEIVDDPTIATLDGGVSSPLVNTSTTNAAVSQDAGPSDARPRKDAGARLQPIQPM